MASPPPLAGLIDNPSLQFVTADRTSLVWEESTEEMPWARASSEHTRVAVGAPLSPSPAHAARSGTNAERHGATTLVGQSPPGRDQYQDTRAKRWPALQERCASLRNVFSFLKIHQKSVFYVIRV